MNVGFRRAHATGAAALGRDPALWLAFGLGTGLSPVAPGTLGALLALPLAWGLRLAGPLVFAVLTAAVFIAGIRLCGYAARRLGVHDHPGINVDEVAGQLIACALVPLDWRWFALAFVAFRVLDIVKPWPIALLDRRVRGGLGIMLDDGAAGVAAGLILRALALVVTGGV